ncbi:unnamed protein product [Mycena citricolor]|uniref:Alpha-type protein kinase domain-containing protein n=1 Tax=Mycena citricolor TaxID=2018698 RepID=A0AAD2GYA3_9AGAR|nr:unnamed protein product [Mycena citricolor]
MSLFDLSLSFVDYILKKTRPLPSSLIIPKICFVEGGIALVHDSTVGKNVHAASSHHRTLVIEELIESLFVKFVHNHAPVPYLAADHPLFYVADFLCFTQHVQYEKLGGLVFISDYQGSELLLSNPQIMTSPDISKESMFGGGNVGALFTAFPEKHKCSGYCCFFGLKPLI